MEEKGINQQLIRKIKDLYIDNKIRIRTMEVLTDGFRTTLGVRQGCVLSPALFNLYVADLDKYMKIRNVEGIMVGDTRIWNLAYADDVVLIAKNREALNDMMQTLRKFRKRGN